MSGTYVLVESEFREALSNDPGAVEKMLNDLADELAGTNQTIAQYTRFNGIIETAQRGNETENQRLQDSIDRIERNIASEEARLRTTFTNLETTIGRLNSQSESLLQVLSGLS